MFSASRRTVCTTWSMGCEKQKGGRGSRWILLAGAMEGRCSRAAERAPARLLDGARAPLLRQELPAQLLRLHGGGGAARLSLLKLPSERLDLP